MTVTNVDICHRMGPLSMLYSKALTSFFGGKKSWTLTYRKSWKLAENVSDIFYRFWYFPTNDTYESCTPWHWPTSSRSPILNVTISGITFNRNNQTFVTNLCQLNKECSVNIFKEKWNARTCTTYVTNSWQSGRIFKNEHSFNSVRASSSC